MTKLKRYILDINKLNNYLDWTLDGVNTLSNEINKLKSCNFGSFYVILPENIDTTKTQECRWGGTGVNLTEYVQSLIWMKLFEDDGLCCIFDHYTSRLPLERTDSLFLEFGTVLKNEVYYLLTQNNASKEIISKCFRSSNAIWHSLCVLTRINFTIPKDKKLNEQNIREFCENAELILIGAYDAEGYVFWEKNNMK